MPGVQIKLDSSTLNNLLVSISGDVSRYMLRLGIQIQSSARRKCPVDTGRLRSSIGVTQKAATQGAITSVGSNVEYALYVHEGTRFQHGRPFLRDALNEVVSAIG